MKNLSIGQVNIAVKAINIVFELDSNRNMDAAEKKLQKACSAYLQTLGILNVEGSFTFNHKLPAEIMKAVKAYM